MITAMWNLWHGCPKCSPGCLNCYVYFLDSKYNKDYNIITKSKSSFHLPSKKGQTRQLQNTTPLVSPIVSLTIERMATIM